MDKLKTPPPKGDGSDPGDREQKRVRAGLFTRLRRYFLAGIVVTAPVAITLYFAWWFVNFIDSQVLRAVPAVYHPDRYLPFSVPGLGLIVVLVGVTLIGFLAAGLVGRELVRIGEGLMARMPVVRSLYAALKQIFETILSQSSQSFREVVLVEYPRRGIWAIGFITGPTGGEVQHLTKEAMINVFLPTTPNPTSGFLLFVPEKDVVRLHMTIEEGAKMVISGGLVTPPNPYDADGRLKEVSKAGEGGSRKSRRERRQAEAAAEVELTREPDTEAVPEPKPETGPRPETEPEPEGAQPDRR